MLGVRSLDGKRLNVVDVLVDVHLLGLLNVDEELLSVRPDLGPRSASDELLYLLPILAE